MYSLKQRTRATLVHVLEADADARQVADAAVATWRQVEAALVPIIGPLGLAALYQRSVALGKARYPWEADRALLRSLYDMVVRLLGAPLSDRLLRPVLDAYAAVPLPACSPASE